MGASQSGQLWNKYFLIFFYWILNYYYLFKDCKASSVWVGAPQSGHLCGLFQLHQIDPFRLAQKFTGHVKIIHAWIYDFGFESAFPPSFVIADITVLELQNWQVWQCPLGQKLVETEGQTGHGHSGHWLGMDEDNYWKFKTYLFFSALLYTKQRVNMPKCPHPQWPPDCWWRRKNLRKDAYFSKNAK